MEIRLGEFFHSSECVYVFYRDIKEEKVRKFQLAGKPVKVGIVLRSYEGFLSIRIIHERKKSKCSGFE